MPVFQFPIVRKSCTKYFSIMTRSFGKKTFKVPEYWKKRSVHDVLIEVWWRVHKLNILVSDMDKKIRKIEKDVKQHKDKKAGHELKELAHMDKKRDKVCAMGKKAMDKKGKK